MDKLKILILNSSAIYGGGEFFCLQLARELYNEGYGIIVGSNNKSLLYQKCSEAGINTEHINFPDKGTKGLGENIKTVRELIKNYNIDIVHSNTNYDRTTGAFAVRGTKAKHVTSLHSLESVQHNITHYIRNKFLTHHFIADGNRIKDLIIKQDNIPESKISVVHNGINPDEMKRDNELRIKVRNEFGISDGEILIGNVGRLVEFKGQKYLLSAFKIISEKYNNAKLIITGDGELMNSLKEYSNALGLNDRVIFTGFRDDLNAVYSAFDIYAHTSVEGGGELFPFSILYAMAQSLPVVAARVGDIPQMVIDSRMGYLVDEKSPFQISNRCMDLINDREKSITLGKNGYIFLEQNFTLKKMTSEIEKIYEKTLVNT